MFKLILTAMVAIPVFVTTHLGQTNRFDEKWLIFNDCPVPYELVVLSVNHYAGHIFMITDAKYFNEKNLINLFGCLSKKYSEFPVLDITLFSDSTNLKVAIKNHFNPPPDANPPDDTSKEDCSDIKRAVRPCPLGYYRANYSRFDGREYFDFSEDPNKVTTRRIKLRALLSDTK